MLRLCYGYIEGIIRKTRRKQNLRNSVFVPTAPRILKRTLRRSGSTIRTLGSFQGSKRSMNQPDSTANEEAHWAKTTKLMFTHLGIWFFFGYVIHMFVVPLNKIVIPILGFPLGFYMAAQGSLIVFVVMLFMFARQQDAIDREHGYAEDD